MGEQKEEQEEEQEHEEEVEGKEDAGGREDACDGLDLLSDLPDLLVAESGAQLDAPFPPDSSSWDWPLSRGEKKARVRMADQCVQIMDKQVLMQALINERMASKSAGKV